MTSLSSWPLLLRREPRFELHRRLGEITPRRRAISLSCAADLRGLVQMHFARHEFNQVGFLCRAGPNADAQIAFA